MPKRTRKPVPPSFPKGVAAPAIRALKSVGITRLEQAAKFSSSELRSLHGIGPKAITIIKAALQAEGKSLAKEQ
jgi:predicted flap endonuclease-1-like 5' DNA nuclease